MLTIEYNKDIILLLNEKYFLEKNLKEYLKYYKESDRDLTNVVAVVNVGANHEWYTNTKKSDTSKNELMLTNKFYSLDNGEKGKYNLKYLFYVFYPLHMLVLFFFR